MPFYSSPMQIFPVAQPPAELLDEFVLQSDTQALRTTSLVCRRWRRLSQQRLFECVAIDPMHDHDLYHLGGEDRARLGACIKKLVVVDRRKVDEIHTANFQPGFSNFLRSLSRLGELHITHPGFSWSKIPGDTVYAILDVLSRPSFHTLNVSVARVFPIPLLLLGPNIKTLVLTYVLAPTQRIMDPELTFGPSQTRLTTLELTRIPCIKEFARLVSPGGQASEVIRCLEVVTLDYIEGFSDGQSHSELVGTFLRHLGDSVKTVQLSMTQLRPEFVSSIPRADLIGLTGLEVLEIMLFIQRRVDGGIMCATEDYILPMIRNLPTPQSLMCLKISCQVFPKGPATLAANQDVISQFVEDLEDALINRKYMGLKKLNLAINLCGLASASGPDAFLHRPERLSGFVWLSSRWRVAVDAVVMESVPRIS